MKIYYYPISTTRCPVVLFAAENGINASLKDAPLQPL